jgi:hypothetical protein
MVHHPLLVIQKVEASLGLRARSGKHFSATTLDVRYIACSSSVCEAIVFEVSSCSAAILPPQPPTLSMRPGPLLTKP